MKLHINTLATALTGAAAMALCAACGDTSDGGSGEGGVSGAPIRLADLLEVAAIRSPLTEVTAASGLDQLGDIPSRSRASDRGELERLLREGAAGVHLFEGPPPPVENDSRELESMDPVQVEGLRALG